MKILEEYADHNLFMQLRTGVLSSTFMPDECQGASKNLRIQNMMYPISLNYSEEQGVIFRVFFVVLLLDSIVFN